MVVNSTGTAAFTNPTNAATAKVGRNKAQLVITLNAAAITGFTTNGSADLYIRPPADNLRSDSRNRAYVGAAAKVGNYTVPKLTVSGDIQGSAYTYGKSTLKEKFGGVVNFDPADKATVKLTLNGLRDNKIDSSKAQVQLAEGDGYYPSEYTLVATALSGNWSGGKTSYSLKTGDLVLNTAGYPILDTNSGREWSCLGGDGHGNFDFNFKISGISYQGLPVASQTFHIHVYVYGYNYTSDAATLYTAAGTPLIQSVLAPLASKLANPPKPAATPIWTWVGSGTKPNLTDHLADDFYLTWPKGVQAKSLKNQDVQVTLKSEKGDTYVLTAGRDYQVGSTVAGETQIAVTLQNWAFEPVYDTMTVKINPAHVKHTGKLATASLSRTYDITSVYAYEAQQGGGGTTIDGTVTAYSFYGLANLTSAGQVFSPVTYTLSTTVGSSTKYYAEDAQGTASLVDSATAAKTFDGSGTADRNLQLIGNTVYITTRLNQSVAKTVAGAPLTFTKVYSGGRLLAPTASDQNLTATPG